jgi:hypothetical protein
MRVVASHSVTIELHSRGAQHKWSGMDRSFDCVSNWRADVHAIILLSDVELYQEPD